MGSLLPMSLYPPDAVRLIQDQRATGAEAPVGMQMVWDWEHSHIIDRVSRIKILLDQYAK